MIKPGLLITLFVVCGVLIAGLALMRGDRPDVNTSSKSGDKLLKDLNTDAVKSIVIKKNDVQVTMDRKDKNWILSSHKNRAAKAERVDALLNSLKTATIVEKRRGSDDVFELHDKGRVELTIKAEAGDKVVYIGKSSDATKSFARNDATGPVLEVDKSLDNDAGIRTDSEKESEKRVLDPAYFYDLKIMALNTDDVIDIAIKRENDSVRIQKVLGDKHEPIQPKQELKADGPKPVWWLTEPENAAADDGAVNNLVSNLAGLNAKAYADNVAEKDRGLDKPGAKVILRLKDGTEQTLTFGKVENDDVILEVSGKAEIYKVYKYIFESVSKDLKKKEEEKKTDATGPNGAPAIPVIPPLPSTTIPSFHDHSIN
jgi:hypothetical protein